MEFEKQSVIAVASIYGVDLLIDNVIACRNRLYDIWNKEYEAICKKEANDECREAIRFILSRNIVCGNALSLKVVDDEGNDTEEPIIFSEWSFVMGDNMQRKDFRFDKLLAGDYEPQADKNNKKRETEGQMTLFSEDKPSDEGEFLTSYIADYRRIQEHGQ
ncbi:MAG: hypothetical protein K6F55_04860 [Eubacterium sp.]|nr:hypothetical protein [Eubacterium sp.]